MNRMGLLEKLSLLSINKLLPMLPLLKMTAGALHQPQIPTDLGYSPFSRMEGPGQQQSQGIMPFLLEGGMQSLGNLAGNQLGGMGLDLLSGLGGSSSNDLTKLLEIIPEDVIRNFLESRQAIR